MIRPVTLDDVPEIAAFYVDIRRDTVPVVHTIDDVERYISSVLVARGTSYVWEEDGTILGWVDVGGGGVDQLYCRRGSTGRGIGKRLLDFAKAQSPAGLQLYTFQVNAGARRFYAREGFAEVELGDGSGNEEGQPDVLLAWQPAPFEAADQMGWRLAGPMPSREERNA